MKRFWISVVLSLITILSGEVASAQILTAENKERSLAGTLTAEEILQLSDQSRNGWEAFVVRTQITNYEQGKLKQEGNFDVFIKGEDKSLVRFLNADVRGQYLLMLVDDMWIYMPNTRRPIRITPLQRLMGDASNGDVARTQYARDYAPTLKAEETLDGVPSYILRLEAKRDGATYHTIEYWVSKETLQPKKAEIYLASGKHYKTILFDTYGEVRGRVLLTQMSLFDRLREGKKTIMRFTSYIPQDIPEKYFNKDYLEKLR